MVQDKSLITFARTPFELAAQGEIFEHMAVDVYQVDNRLLTLLHVASMHGQMLTVRYLLSRGADTGARDLDGRSPLHYAAFHGHQHVVRELLNFDVTGIDDVDHEGNTALMFACCQRRSPVVKELLKQGADISLQNRFSDSCYSIAHTVCARDILSLLEKRIVDVLEKKLFE